MEEPVTQKCLGHSIPPPQGSIAARNLHPVLFTVATLTSQRVLPLLFCQRCRRRRWLSRPPLSRSGRRSTRAGSARNPWYERTRPPCEVVIGAVWGTGTCGLGSGAHQFPHHGQMIDSFDIVHIFQRSYIHDLYDLYDL